MQVHFLGLQNTTEKQMQHSKVSLMMTMRIQVCEGVVKAAYQIWNNPNWKQSNFPKHMAINTVNRQSIKLSVNVPVAHNIIKMRWSNVHEKRQINNQIRSYKTKHYLQKKYNTFGCLIHVQPHEELIYQQQTNYYPKQSMQEKNYHTIVCTSAVHWHNLHAQQPFVRVLLIAQTTSLIYNIHMWRF